MQIFVDESKLLSGVHTSMFVTGASFFAVAIILICRPHRVNLAHQVSRDNEFLFVQKDF